MYSHKLLPSYLRKVRQNLCIPDSSKSTVAIMAPDRDDSHMSVDADVTTSPSTSMQFSEDSPLFGCFVPYSCSGMSPTRFRPDCCTPESPASSPETASPLRNTYFPAFNPFNRGLKERLKNPVVSPDMFTTVVSPSEDSNEFKWTIEDMSRIKPALIEEEFDFEDPIDKQAEVDYQQTIETFFENPEHHFPSPLELQQNPLKRSEYLYVKPCLRSLTPCRPFGSGSASGTPCQDVSTQTVLSLPPELPKNIESMLKYYSDTSSDDMSFNNLSTMRRKLVFRKDEDDTSPLDLSRSRDNSPFVRVRAAGTIMSRTDGSPCSPISPLGISPIAFADKKSGCNNLLSPIHSTTPGNNHQKENIHPTDAYQNRLIECIKMFESPQLTVGVRQNRKRRRPSQSMLRDVQLFYEDRSPFYTELLGSAEKAASKRCASRDNSKVCMDTFSDNAVDSEDTGYRTASFTFNESCVKPRIDTWVNLFTDRMNNVHASTPTSGPLSLPK